MSSPRVDESETRAPGATTDTSVPVTASGRGWKRRHVLDLDDFEKWDVLDDALDVDRINHDALPSKLGSCLVKVSEPPDNIGTSGDCLKTR